VELPPNIGIAIFAAILVRLLMLGLEVKNIDRKGTVFKIYVTFFS